MQWEETIQDSRDETLAAIEWDIKEINDFLRPD